jgi:hypothetical protein
MFAGLLAEIRAYGEGLIIAEQIPAKLVPDVIKNTAVKIVHRLPAADDRAAVGATMNLTGDQSAYLVTLIPGEAAVFTDGMDYPLLTRMPDGTGREISNPAVTASPAPLVTSRSLTCGPECHSSPCMLRQVRAAQRAATSDPRITVWAELSVLAHLTGWTMPMPGPVFVASRIPVISARVSGPGLAVHVIAAMHAALEEDRWLCERNEPQWLAPPYQWALVLDSLRTRHRRDPEAGPDPRTAEWEAAYSRAIPGQSCADQPASATSGKSTLWPTAPARPAPSSTPSVPGLATRIGNYGSPTPSPPSGTAAGPWTTCSQPPPGHDDER